MRAVTVALCALFVLAAANAQAQRVSIDLRGDTVTLVATNATLDDILGEWSRSAGLKVVTLKGGAIGGSPITIVMRDVTERQALEMLLRNLSGYVLSARRDRSTGASAFEQILILPTSASSNSGSPSPAPQIPSSIPSSLEVPPSFVAQRLAPADADSVAAVSPVEEAGPGAGAGSGAAESAIDERAIFPPVDPSQRPPSPLFRPSTAPDANNPFGRAPGASRPGTVSSPPPGVVYPPVTNPNALGGFKPAGTP